MRQLINEYSPETTEDLDDMQEVVTSVKDRVLIKSAPRERRAEEGAPSCIIKASSDDRNIRIMLFGSGMHLLRRYMRAAGGRHTSGG